MQENFIKYKYFFIIGAAAVIIFAYQWWSRQPQESQSPILIEEMEGENEAPEEKVEESSSVMVDVKGAVKVKGVYELQTGQRVKDAISVAGGLAENVDEKQINLAQLLEDEMVIYVPTVGEEGFENTASSAGKEKEQIVNINKATSEELQTISGIGASKAAAIIQYREENGLFQKIEDITNVSGIGEKSFEKMKEKISVK